MILKNFKLVFIRLIHPSAITQLKMNDKPVSEKTNMSIISFVVLYIFIFIVGTTIVVITGVDPVTSASAVASTLGNVGPGLGTIGPLFNYAHLPEIDKTIFSLLMIIGRLEINTLFIILSKSFWKL